MKFDFNRRYTTIALYALGVIVAGALIVAMMFNYVKISRVLNNVFELLTPFVIGFVLAYLLNPILRACERMLAFLTRDRISLRVNRVCSLILSYLFALLVLGLFFSIVIPQLASSIATLAGQISRWIFTAQTFINELIEKYDLQNIQNIQPDVWNTLRSTATQMLTKASSYVTDAIPHVFSATMTLTSGVFDAIVGVIISVYVLLSKERFFAQCKKLLNALMPHNVVEKLVSITHQSHEIFSGFISGKILDSCIIGLLCFAGMNLLRMPYATLISVIVGVTNVIPYFGPFIGAIPSILILFIVDPIKSIWFAVFILVLQQLDGNVIGPKILGDSTGLSAFWVIFAITVFGSLMGVVGMFIGVPLFAVIYSLIRQFCEWRLAQKGLPTRTSDYASDRHKLLNRKQEQQETKKRDQ